MSIVSNNIFVPANELEGKVSPMPKGETIASIIERVRVKGKLTYQAMADASGGRISPNYLHNLEKGAPTKRLSAEIIVGVARATNESALYIFQLAAGLPPTAKDDPLHQMVNDYLNLPKESRDSLKLMMDIIKDKVLELSRANDSQP